MPDKKSPKLIGLFVIGFILLNFPIINLFGKDDFVLGIPAMYAYFFIVWLVLIIFIARIMRTNEDPK